MKSTLGVPIQLALATDHNMLDAALVAMGTALENLTRQAVVHFLGYQLPESDKKRIERLCHIHQAELMYHELTDEMFEGGTQRDPNITLVTLGRMYLPQLTEGRVLYLDCDMRIKGDVAEIYDTDMQGSPIAAVRDFYVLYQIAKRGPDCDQLSTHREVLGEVFVGDYFNAGLLLLDCDKIRQDTKLQHAMIDLNRASKFRFLDQDYLNLLFAGKTKFLPQAWNSVWGRDPFHRKIIRKLDWLPVEERASDAAIVHYTGPHKPWKSFRISAIQRKRVFEIFRYRMTSKRILSQL